MLRILLDADNVESAIGLKIEGDFIDVGPIFKLSVPRKRSDKYMDSNIYRKEYKRLVEEEIKKPSIYTTPKPYKGIFYHKLLVKMLLHSLDLLDFEWHIAQAMGREDENPAQILSMLPGYNFSWSKINLTYYDDYGREEIHPVRFFIMETEGCMYITLGLRHYD